jgi:hypothetical protein
VRRRLTTTAVVASAAAALAALGGGCKPSLDDVVSIVAAPRVLAVRSELVVADASGTAPAPTTEAEARPTEAVKLRALHVDGGGAVATSSLDWAFCDERKPLAELGPVSPACLAATGDRFAPLGAGDEVTGAMPRDACQQFGPDTPQSKTGEPPGRPVDADGSGGYYQPLRLLDPTGAGEAVTLGMTRVLCTLASSSPDVVAAYQQRYHRNANPEVASLGVVGASAPWVAADGAPGATNAVAVGEHLALEVSWAACPTMDVADDGVCGPDETGTTCGTCGADVTVNRRDCCVDVNCVHARGCAGAERYVVLDRASGTLVDRRESIAVAWYATGGAFDFDRAGRGNDDPATVSDDGWRAPDAPGRVTMWVVLRDERGGVGWKTYALDVR